MVGAGGGFLIVPTLIALFKLPIKEAIGTSLTVIAINSLVGFKGDIAAGISFNWPLLLTFTGLTLLGIIIGTNLGQRVSAAHLKKAFAYFILVISLLILSHELYFIVRGLN